VHESSPQLRNRVVENRGERCHRNVKGGY
jgi:hypothetical protein